RHAPDLISLAANFTGTTLCIKSTAQPSTLASTRLNPHSLRIEDPMTPPVMNLAEHEGQMIASRPAIVPPPASGPLTVEEDAGDITVEEEAVDEHEIDEEASDDDSDKGPTFVRSLGAWSKPLHFTPSPTPPEPATPRFEASEMLQSQIDSFWPSIGEAIVNGSKKKGRVTVSKNLVTQMPVDKIPPPALKEDGSLRFPWAARMNQSSRNLFRATEPTCGALGHKEKRCLQPPNPRDAAPVTKEPLDSNEEIPVVDIVTLVHNSANTLVDHLDRKSCS
ncbi:unnamed protein product, partial [Brassica oleracea]